MLTDEAIAVELPDGAGVTESDRAVLKAACEAVLALRFERSDAFRETVKELRDAGWSVRWRLGWVVTAKRGNDFEEASGRTLDEALASVTQLVRADAAAGWP